MCYPVQRCLHGDADYGRRLELPVPLYPIFLPFYHASFEFFLVMLVTYKCLVRLQDSSDSYP
jgi:hypothetical protein